jgi:hypothetical protein
MTTQTVVNEFVKREELVFINVEYDKHFSWLPCDCCKSTLGGDRYTVRACQDVDSTALIFDVCTECMEALANLE